MRSYSTCECFVSAYAGSFCAWCCVYFPTGQPRCLIAHDTACVRVCVAVSCCVYCLISHNHKSWKLITRPLCTQSKHRHITQCWALLSYPSYVILALRVWVCVFERERDKDVSGRVSCECVLVVIVFLCKICCVQERTYHPLRLVNDEIGPIRKKNHRCDLFNFTIISPRLLCY